LYLCFFSRRRPAPSSPLFPYTTLFRSIVAGGGTVLAQAATVLDKVKLEGDEQVGVNLVRRSLEEPLRQIAHNAGAEGSVILEKGSEEHTSELQSLAYLVCRLLLEKKKK